MKVKMECYFFLADCNFLSRLLTFAEFKIDIALVTKTPWQL